MPTPINSSNLPTNQNFKFEDFPGAEQWFAQFLSSLNLFVQPVYQILNGGVTYQNLTIPRIYTVTTTTPASGDVAFNFTNPLKIQPSAVLIGNIYELGQTSVHPTSATSVYWHISQGTIYVDNIPNLTTSTTYVITLIVF
jgi:hypothetical protein